MTLASLCSWAGRFESYLLATPEGRFSRDVAQLLLGETCNTIKLLRQGQSSCSWLAPWYAFRCCQWQDTNVVKAVKDKLNERPNLSKFGMVYLQMSRLMTKPTTWHVRPAKTQISLGMKKAWFLSYPLSAQRRLSGWSESSLGAQSFCWFCH